MSLFTKLARGQSARELIERCRAIEPRRADGGPFTLAVQAAGESRLLIVSDASGQAIGSVDLLSPEGVRAAALRLIHQHQQRAASAKGFAGDLPPTALS